MQDVFELALFGLAWGRWAGGVLAGLGLDGGLFIQAEQYRVRRRIQIQIAYGGGFGGEVGIGGPVQPAPDPVHLDRSTGRRWPGWS